MSKKQIIRRKDGSVITITTNDSGEYICDGYDAENDITKSHEEIVCRIAEINLKTEDAPNEE